MVSVNKAQFFYPDKLNVLRDYLDRVIEADIPLRPPYGIVLNRGGAMLDPRSEGYLAAPTFQTFYQELMYLDGCGHHFMLATAIFHKFYFNNKSP